MAIPKFLKGLSLNNQKLIAVADPTAATDGANKQYVDAVAAGRDWKESVRVKSTANITISSPGATINGVTMAANDRVLLNNQTTGSENGIWVWNGAAVPMTRATDADTAAKLNAGATVSVMEGTVDADTRWTLTTNDPITLGTTTLVFTKDAGGGTTYTFAQGTQESGGTVTARLDGSSLSQSASGLKVNGALVGKIFAADCVATTNPQTFTHALGTDIVYQFWEGNNPVEPDVVKASTSGGQITADFGVAPTAGQFRLVVFGLSA